MAIIDYWAENLTALNLWLKPYWTNEVIESLLEQDISAGGTERTFLRRQKAIEADENRRTNMAVESML